MVRDRIFHDEMSQYRKYMLVATVYSENPKTSNACAVTEF